MSNEVAEKRNILTDQNEAFSEGHEKVSITRFVKRHKSAMLSALPAIQQEFAMIWLLAELRRIPTDLEVDEIVERAKNGEQTADILASLKLLR